MDRIETAFKKFHAANPHVYKLFCRFAEQMIDAGHTHSSAKLIMERLRWELALQTDTDLPVALNNNYTSRYARMWMADNPGWSDFFRTRQLWDNSTDSTWKAQMT